MDYGHATGYREPVKALWSDKRLLWWEEPYLSLIHCEQTGRQIWARAAVTAYCAEP